ncbi:IS30 family transposase [Paraburkholderia sp. BCC1886]|uniref:IS30 family transposase n=1 Tax=Paraburkholderia sp. BCC1886 TaxID=2562670 RepID=UPI0011824C60|nr:IS30 family transposase [Paraburkholderia sp. BCC1886]
MASIHIRPPEANERLPARHWEGDLIKGAGNRSAVGTLIDCSTLFVMLVKMEDSTAEAAPKDYSAAFAPLDPELLKTLTYDQGKEMALHGKLAETTGIKGPTQSSTAL